MKFGTMKSIRDEMRELYLGVRRGRWVLWTSKEMGDEPSTQTGNLLVTIKRVRVSCRGLSRLRLRWCRGSGMITHSRMGNALGIPKWGRMGGYYRTMYSSHNDG